MSASVLLLNNSVFATDETPKVETKTEKAEVTVKETTRVKNKITAEKIETKIETKVAAKKVKKKAKITEKKVCPKRLGSRLKRKRC